MLYRCSAAIVGGKFLGKVEADSPEDAIRKAYELEECYASVCHQCSRQIEDPEVFFVTVEDEDGNAFDDRPEAS